MTVTPTVPGGTFDWLLPEHDPGDVEDRQHRHQRLRPVPVGARPSRERLAWPTVAEALKARLHGAGRPGPDNDFTLRAPGRGRQRSDESRETSPITGHPSFTLDPIGQEIVTCTVYNSFNYAPDIALTKVNSPTEVRGDLDPPAHVTSTYRVTNPGNTPLVGGHGDRRPCGPVAPGADQRPQHR